MLRGARDEQEGCNHPRWEEIAVYVKKGKQRPFKLLAILLYSGASWIVDNERYGVTTVSTSKLRALLIWKYRDVRIELRWLANNGYLSDLRFTYGKAQFKLTPPVRPRMGLTIDFKEKER